MLQILSMFKNLINSYKSLQFLQIFSLLIISYKSHNSYKFFKSSNLSPTGMKFRSSWYVSTNKLGYFYVTAWSIVEKGYNINFAAQLLEKWLRYWQWPTKLAVEAPSWCLNFFVVLTLLLPTGVLPKKKFSSIGWEMAEILTVTNKAGYRSS